MKDLVSQLLEAYPLTDLDRKLLLVMVSAEESPHSRGSPHLVTDWPKRIKAQPRTPNLADFEKPFHLWLAKAIPGLWPISYSPSSSSAPFLSFRKCCSQEHFLRNTPHTKPCLRAGFRWNPTCNRLQLPISLNGDAQPDHPLATNILALWMSYLYISGFFL